MELEVGMYVRFKDKRKNTYIRKVIDGYKKGWYGCRVDKDANNVPYVSQKNILKTSYNIIDLIEVGDIVNDKKIVDIGCLTNGPEEGTKTIDYYIAPNTVYYFKNENIKSIVTREEFESRKYEVE